MRIFSYTLKALLAAAIGLGLLCIIVSTAFAAPAYPTMPAHSKVLSSEPAIGSTITTAPTKVTVTVAENLNPDPTKSNLFVYGPSADATNTLISQGNAQIPLSNQKEMSVSITPNSAHMNGIYVVVWETVSADDGDPAAGAFSFTVNANGVSSTPTPSASQNHTPTPISTSTNNASGIPIWASIVVALVALIVGLGLGRFVFAGQRKPTPSSSFSAMRTAASKNVEQEEANKHP
ncbi:MAG: copper resistance protein CopC [Ktedonobacteraceae bacterium]